MPETSRPRPDGLDSLPDLPEAVNHPIFQKLELIAQIFFKSKNPDPQAQSPAALASMDDQNLLMCAIDESFAYVTYLTEYVKRVAKGIIPATETKYDKMKAAGQIPVPPMERKFTEPMIKDMLFAALNARVEAGDLHIRDENGSPENPELENIIQDMLDNGLVTRMEMMLGIRSLDLKTFFLAKFPADQEHKPSIIARYAYDPDESHRIASAKTLIAPAELIAEITNSARISQTAVISRVPDGGQADNTAPDSADEPRESGQRDSIIIEFEPLEGPTLKRATLASRGITPRNKVEDSPEMLEKIKMPAALTEINSGLDDGWKPLLLSGEKATFGTDRSNDFIIAGDYKHIDGKTGETKNKVEPVHGMIYMEGGNVIIQAVSAPMKLEGKLYKDDGGGNIVEMPANAKIVVANHGEIVAPGQLFWLKMKGGVHLKDETEMPCFSVEKDMEFTRKEIKEEILGRYRRFLDVKAEKLFKLLTFRDEKKTKEVTEGLMLVGKKIASLEDAARQYGIVLFRDNEREEINAESMHVITNLLNNIMKGHYRNLSTALMEQGEKNANLYAGDIDLAYARKYDASNEALLKIEALVSFAAKHGVPIADQGKRQELLDQVLQGADTRVKQLRKARQEKMAAEKEATDRAFKEKGEHQAKINTVRARYKNIHSDPGEDVEGLLEALANGKDEKEVFYYVGPVIKITDGHKIVFEDPRIFDGITIGDHKANTHCLDQKVGAEPTGHFMAEIKFDAGESCRFNWLDGKIRFTGTHSVPLGPSFILEPDTIIRLGGYNISVQSGHAYTEKAFKAECPKIAQELYEVIFDMNHTSPGQDKVALGTLQKMVDAGYIKWQSVVEILGYGMNKLMNNLADWNEGRTLQMPEHDHMARSERTGKTDDVRSFIDLEMESKPLQDAHHFEVLKMLLEVSGKNAFIRLSQSNSVFIAAIKQGARLRARTYVDMAKRAAEQKSRGSRLLEALSLRDGSNHAKAQEMLKEKAAAGAVQIATFAEMQLVDIDTYVAALPDIDPEYLERIKKIIEIRRLFRAFNGGKTDPALIKELNEMIPGLKMKDVFSAYEIEIANHNIEVSLNEERPLEYYLRKLAVSVAKKNLGEAMIKKDSRKEMAIIDELGGQGLIEVKDLAMISPSDDVVDSLDELRANARDLTAKERDNREYVAARRAESEVRRKEILRMRGERSAALGAEGLELARIIYNAETVIDRALKDGSLEKLLEIVDTINDQTLALRMERRKISLAIEEVIVPQAARGAAAISGVKSLKTWDNIRDDYFETAARLGMIEAGKVMAGDSADYRLMLLDEAVLKRVLTPGSIGVTRDQMVIAIREDKKLRKIRKLEEKYDKLLRGLSADMEDLDFLEQVKPAEITDADEKQVAENYLRKACRIRMDQVEQAIAQRIAQKKDISYLNLLAREIVASGYEA